MYNNNENIENKVSENYSLLPRKVISALAGLLLGVGVAGCGGGGGGGGAPAGQPYQGPYYYKLTANVIDETNNVRRYVIAQDNTGSSSQRTFFQNSWPMPLATGITELPASQVLPYSDPTMEADFANSVPIAYRDGVTSNGEIVSLDMEVEETPIK